MVDRVAGDDERRGATDPSDATSRGGMVLLASGSKLFYAATALALVGLAVALLVTSAYRWLAAARRDWDVLNQTLECIGLVTIAIAVFEVGKFMVEEELIRERQLRSVLESRRSLTKFLTIVVITLSLEGLVLVFETKLEHIADLIYPTALLLVAALTVVALGVFQRLSSESAGNRIGADKGKADSAGPAADG